MGIACAKLLILASHALRPSFMSFQERQTGGNFPIRLGFVPLSDCAPIAVAQEVGIFKRYGLNVVLSRELGWASVRDKMFYGDLDARRLDEECSSQCECRSSELESNSNVNQAFSKERLRVSSGSKLGYNNPAWPSCRKIDPS